MKTRSTKKTPNNDAEPPQDSPVGASLEASTTNPPLLFVLPDNASPDARIATLPNPTTSTPMRYYVCPERGIHEFTRIAAPKQSPRSCLIAPAATNVTTPDQDSIVSKGYAIENADLFIATPVDPLFILLPALIPAPDSHEQLFLAIDDHLDHLAENAKHLKHLLRSNKLRQDFEQRANAVCDNVDLGDEKMYRLSNDKLLAELFKKAHRMTAKGLPASIESQLVTEALRVPVTTVQPTAQVQSQEDAILASQEEFPPPLKELSEMGPVPLLAGKTVITKPSSDASAPPNIESLLRVRTALDLILSTYVPSTLHKPLKSLLLSDTSPLDFAPLEAYLDQISSMKKSAQATRALSDNISRKRSGFVDEEAEEIRAEKRRKKEEEDAKKKNQSRGVKQLSKVNTNGMMKLSSFFTKAPAKSK